MYQKVRVYDLPSFVYWILKFPILLIKFIVAKMRGVDFDKVLNNYRIVNEIRKTCLYYAEKDNQTRSTIYCAYRFKKYVVSVKLRFNKKAKKQMYEDFRESLEIGTCNVSNITYKRGYAYFDVLLDSEPLYEYESDNVSATIGTGLEGLFYWNWTKFPHLLLVGEIGQGKSVFVRYLLNSLFSSGHEVWCVDGKVIDYTRFKHNFKTYEPNNANDKSRVIDVVKRFRAYMYKRLDEMKKLGIYEYQESDNLKPKFLIIDEYISIVEGMTKEERIEFEKVVSELILLGRACGYIVIISLQRGDTKYINGALRDNFMCRVVVGGATDTSYRMMFDEVVSGFEVGKAWCMLGNELNVISIPFYKEIIDNKVELANKERHRANEQEESGQ